MFTRLLLTAASIVVGLLAAHVLDCAGPMQRIAAGDPIGVCAVVDSMGGGAGWWLAAGLGLFALIALIVTWTTPPGPGRRERKVAATLARNLGRLPELTTESSEPGLDSGANAIRLTRRLEAVETSLETDVSPSRELTQQWMGLLREANDLHNRAQLTTDDFKTINTRLLDLFSAPPIRTGELTHQGSTTSL